MRAKFPGICARTAQPIKPGDEIRSLGVGHNGQTLWALVNPPPPPPTGPVWHGIGHYRSHVKRHQR